MQEQPTLKELDEPKALNTTQKLIAEAAANFAARIGRKQGKDYSVNEQSIEYANGAIECLTEQLTRTKSDSKKLKIEAAIRRRKIVLQKLRVP